MSDSNLAIVPVRSEHENVNDVPISSLDFNYNNVIEVRAGAEDTPFVVHVDVICVKAKFFRVACREDWREGREKLVRLPEAKPETFQRYIDWTYREALVAEATLSDGLRQSVDMYLLGEFLDDIKLRNKTLKAIHRHMIVDLLHPGVAETNLIWEKTPPGSPLRRLVVDATVQRMDSVAFKQHISEWPADLVQQVAVSLKQQATSVRCYDFQTNLATYLETEGGS